MNNLLESCKQSLKASSAYKLPLGLSLVGLVLIIGGAVSSNLFKATPKSYPKESLVEGTQKISVDVSGAVNKAGVYQLSDGSRIEEAISAAGGLSTEADQGYISKYLNMAQKLIDGSKIYIPKVGEQNVAKADSPQVAGVAIKLNINNASQSELEALPGVGPVTAQKIISGRPYQSVEDVFNKKIVGKAVFDKIKDSISVY